MAAILPIKIEQGSTFLRTFTVKNKVTGVPIDVSLDSFEGALRDDFESAAKVSFTFDMTNASSGIVGWVMDAATSAGLTLNDFPDLKSVYTVNWIKADTTVIRMLEGKATITLDANLDPEVAP